MECSFISTRVLLVPFRKLAEAFPQRNLRGEPEISFQCRCIGIGGGHITWLHRHQLFVGLKVIVLWKDKVSGVSGVKRQVKALCACVSRVSGALRLCFKGFRRFALVFQGFKALDLKLLKLLNLLNSEVYFTMPFSRYSARFVRTFAAAPSLATFAISCSTIS